jgi:heme-degrading monooxygenase HmoA
MTTVIVKHTVEDYGKWKSAFDGNQEVRRAAGSQGASILQNAEDPNAITIVLRWDNLANAKKFLTSPELKEVMQDAGVTSAPEVIFLEESATSVS